MHLRVAQFDNPARTDSAQYGRAGAPYGIDRAEPLEPTTTDFASRTSRQWAKGSLLRRDERSQSDQSSGNAASLGEITRVVALNEGKARRSLLVPAGVANASSRESNCQYPTADLCVARDHRLCAIARWISSFWPELGASPCSPLHRDPSRNVLAKSKTFRRKESKYTSQQRHHSMPNDGHWEAINRQDNPRSSPYVHKGKQIAKSLPHSGLHQLATRQCCVRFQQSPPSGTLFASIELRRHNPIHSSPQQRP